MAAVLLFSLSALLGLIAIVHGQSSQDLTIRIVKENTKDYLDTKLKDAEGHILYLSLCRGSGNQAIVRINPSGGTSEIMDESGGLTKDTKGVTSCMFDSPSNVSCKEGNHFCELNNNCVAEIKSSCSPSNMRTMHYVDVTLSSAEGLLIVDNCLVLCEAEGYKEVDALSEGNGISDLAVGLIIAGVILVASLLVIGAVIWKIRDSKLLRKHHVHHIHYVET
ncbi:uncharacterized protein LOC106069880 [Biomphalaria glabrata]|uniref:Uncharacterized protein LOC106069880 n=1 Tax=Biomphalaria glabrata TaxID=6526 RepID=A0A9W2YBS1_BIOGL|nr:uncharacterized protein LOC106069880 [Biomphalaria glabrata]XP_055860155.1 uncharacterized protein LOC106069880 [Biomphalaria glabrata]